VTPTTCKHCRRRYVTAARGLCRACHTDPAIRSQYGMHFAFRLGVGLANRTPPPPPFPTRSRVGTAARVLIMGARVECGFSPYHPEDERACGAHVVGRGMAWLPQDRMPKGRLNRAAMTGRPG
jgi:hypothetical protein